MIDRYAAIADTYDIMIDWTARIARERPFFARFFQQANVWRVLDVGSATGHHSRLFAELGAKVIGLDASPVMVRRARELTPGVNPHFVEGEFTTIPQLKRQFDLITVLGNTLAHLHDKDDLRQALQAMYDALSPAGHLCLQLINYDKLLETGSCRLPLLQRQVEGRDYLFLREHRLLDTYAEFTINILVRNGDWHQQIERSEHLPITSSLLEAVMKEVGFSEVTLYGDYERTPFNPADSGALIAVGGMQ